MSELSNEAIQDIKQLALAGMGPQTVPGGNIPYILVPEGYDAKPVPELIFNEHCATPQRIKAWVTAFDAPSFERYYSLFSDPNSQVFADEIATSVIAILDYHAAGEGTPRWGSHRVTLTMRHTVEWAAWFGKNNNKFTQQEFAEFLEQHSSDISTPSPASIMEIASDLSGTIDVEFGGGIRQQNGNVKFKYTEATKTSVGGSQVEVPDRFTLSFPVFVGAEKVSVEALLRFRLNGGKLSFFFTLIRPEEVVRKAFLDVRNLIAKDLGLVIINGSPSK